MSEFQEEIGKIVETVGHSVPEAITDTRQVLDDHAGQLGDIGLSEEQVKSCLAELTASSRKCYAETTRQRRFTFYDKQSFFRRS